MGPDHDLDGGLDGGFGELVGSAARMLTALTATPMEGEGGHA